MYPKHRMFHPKFLWGCITVSNLIHILLGWYPATFFIYTHLTCIQLLLCNTVHSVSSTLLEFYIKLPFQRDLYILYMHHLYKYNISQQIKYFYISTNPSSELKSNLWIGIWMIDHGESIPRTNGIFSKIHDEYDYDEMIHCSE